MLVSYFPVRQLIEATDPRFFEPMDALVPID